MIQLQNFSIGFGERMLLDQVSTNFAKGQLTALIGRNGSGKSTLLRALAGLNTRYHGNIILHGTHIKCLSLQQLARTLAFVTTSRTRIPNLSCQNVVSMGRAPYTNWMGHMQSVDSDIVMQSIRSVGMEQYSLRTMDTMSDGECQRIMIARALAQDTPIILLDEPTSFLDILGRHELVTLLASLAHEQGKCILFSTHELDIAIKMCDTIALVDNGVLHHLPTREMMLSGHIERLFYK